MRVRSRVESLLSGVVFEKDSEVIFDMYNPQANTCTHEERNIYSTAGPKTLF